jgi:hypothetical protein
MEMPERIRRRRPENKPDPLTETGERLAQGFHVVLADVMGVA